MCLLVFEFICLYAYVYLPIAHCLLLAYCPLLYALCQPCSLPPAQFQGKTYYITTIPLF